MNSPIDAARRNVFKLTAAGLLGAGLFARADKVAAQQSAVRTITGQLQALGNGPSQRLLRAPRYGGRDEPIAPTTADALTRAWHQQRFAALFDAIAPRGVSAVLLRNVNNSAYFAGYWVFASERPQAAFKNRDDEAPWLFHPTSYNDVLATAWRDGGRAYFDFPHAEGGFPNEGRVAAGPAVDLFEFLLEGLREKGVQGGVIGIDGELYPSEERKLANALPGVRAVNINDAIRALRIVKTEEELALYSRSYLYSDRAQAFARDYLLTYGTDITDLELEWATQLWLLDDLYSDIELGGGRANFGAATRATVRIRAGRATGSPHPNQPYYARIAPDVSMQANTVVKINGNGGEVYRTYLTAKSDGGFDAHALRLWEGSLHCCDIQASRQREGVRANAIAREIHQYQVDNGLHPYVYHRAAHGLAFEGHYPPYIALGDETVLARNVACSQEPGLYDPVRGYGFNWSDTVVTGIERGVRLSHAPYSREWSLVRL